MVAIFPCIHFWRRFSFHDSLYSNPKKANRIIETCIKMYDKGEKNYQHMFFHPDCFEQKFMYVRDEDYTPTPTKKQLNNVKNWLEKCDEYLMHLDFPKIYVLLQYDEVLNFDKNKPNYKSLLFQLFPQYENNGSNVLPFYKKLENGSFQPNKKFNLDKTIQQYWKDLNNIILDAPSVPKNCPIILYRGTSRHEKKYKKPFSSTMSYDVAERYQDKYMNIYKLEEGTNALPLFYMDNFPYENEVLMSSSLQYTQKMKKKNKDDIEISFSVQKK